MHAIDRLVNSENCLLILKGHILLFYWGRKNYATFVVVPVHHYQSLPTMMNSAVENPHNGRESITVRVIT